MDDFIRERQARREAEAKAQGFSSWEEHVAYLKERYRQNHAVYERKLDEKCARLGKTREQLYDEDPQRYIPDCWMPECDCDCEYSFLTIDSGSNIVSDHPIDFFCPKILVEYRSQELMSFPDDQHCLRPHELEIMQGDKSNRLSEATLEGFGAFKSQDTSLQLPIWAKGNSGLQKIISASPSTSTTPLLSASFRSPSFSPTPVEFGHNTVISDSPTNTTTHAQIDSKPSLQPSESLEKRHSRGIFPAEPQSWTPRSISPEKTKPQKNSTGIAKGRRKSRQKRQSSTASRIQKTPQNPTRGLRSHHPTKFYELNLDGIADTAP